MRFLRGLSKLAIFASAILWGGAGSLEARDLAIGFAQDTLANDWRAAQVRDVERELARHPGVRLLVTDAQGDTARNVQDIEDLADRGIDLLMVSPRDGRAMAPAIARVFSRGIPVVLLTRSIEGESYTTFLGADDYLIGRAAAEELATHLRGKGRILILQGVPTASTAQNRTRGFLDRMVDFPALNVAAIKAGNYLRSGAIAAMEEVLATGTPFDAVFAQSDSMAEGARMALRAVGRKPAEIPTVGVDYIPAAALAIRAGEQLASFTYPTCGQEGARAALDILAGKAVPRRITVPFQRVTRDNADKIPTVF